MTKIQCFFSMINIDFTENSIDFIKNSTILPKNSRKSPKKTSRKQLKNSKVRWFWTLPPTGKPHKKSLGYCIFILAQMSVGISHLGRLVVSMCAVHGIPFVYLCQPKCLWKFPIQVDRWYQCVQCNFFFFLDTQWKNGTQMTFFVTTCTRVNGVFNMVGCQLHLV